MIVCVSAATPDERGEVVPEESRVLISDGISVDVDSNSVVGTLTVLVLSDPATVRLGTGTISDEVVISSDMVVMVVMDKVVASGRDVNERDDKAENDD